MAGIGFRLQHLLHRNTYRSVVAAYLYAALISAGPWLLAIGSLAVIGLLGALLVSTETAALFRAVVITTYLGSLALTGPLQLGTTRYIADRLFVSDLEALWPCFRAVCCPLLLGAGGLAASFFLLSGLDSVTALGAVVLFQMVSLTWMGMLFLSAAKDYIVIVRAFALGYGLAAVLTLLGGDRFGLVGMVWGFATGMAVVAILLVHRIRVEFPSPRSEESAVWHHIHSMPYLIGVGLFYNLGIAIDKVVFWAGPHGIQLRGLYYAAPRYDTAIFLAYLSTIPAMALFLIRIETGFYKRYAAFFATVTGGGSLGAIQRRRDEMFVALRLSVTRLLTLQGGVTLVLFLAMPALLGWLGLDVDLVPLLRIGLLAALAQVLLLILLILFLYFDWQRDAAWLCFAFFSCNAALTTLTQFTEPRYHGFGYLFGCLLPLGAGLALFEHRARDLVYRTFTQQPIRG